MLPRVLPRRPAETAWHRWHCDGHAGQMVRMQVPLLLQQATANAVRAPSGCCCAFSTKRRSDPSRLGERDRRTRAPACSNQVRPVEGRPFTSAHADLLADAGWMHPAPHVHAMRGWARDCAAAREQADNATEYGVLGELWLTHAQHEHASVASFSRYSLELLKYARRAHRRGRVGPRMGRAIGSARRHTCFWRRTQRRPTKCATPSQVFAPIAAAGFV